MYRKTYEITGYTFDGAVYCPDHKPGEDVNPIFLGDETSYTFTCDVCGEEIETTVIPIGADDYENSLSAKLRRE